MHHPTEFIYRQASKFLKARKSQVDVPGKGVLLDVRLPDLVFSNPQVEMGLKPKIGRNPCRQGPVW